jgi:hypothetical protein
LGDPFQRHLAAGEFGGRRRSGVLLSVFSISYGAGLGASA